jgi:hypothetical protein
MDAVPIFSADALSTLLTAVFFVDILLWRSLELTPDELAEHERTAREHLQNWEEHRNKARDLIYQLFDSRLSLPWRRSSRHAAAQR